MTTGWQLRAWWKRHHLHRRANITINRYGDITRTCLDCGDILTTHNPAAQRPENPGPEDSCAK